MAIEKIQAQIIAEVDDQSFKKAWDDIKLYARDTKKELDKSFMFQLQLDKANTKLQLEEARKMLSQAKKDWDKELILKMTIKTDELQSKLTEAGRSLTNFKNTWETGVSRLSMLFWSLWNAVSWVITKFWLLAVWAGLLKLWTQALFLWDKLEQANISFETMLWSADKAKSLLNDLAIFASKTPFELIWLRDTAKQLIAFWIEQENLIPTLKALWDVSAWLSVPIDRIAYAYWQVKTAWRLMGQDLMQFTSAWVPLIAELAKNMWVAQSAIKWMVSEWKIWFTDVQHAFETMTWEWWKFNDLMIKQSDSLTGRWSNLKDKANSMLESIWTAIIPFAKWVVSVMSWGADQLINIFTWLNAFFNVWIHYMISRIFLIQKAWNIVLWNIRILFNGFIWTFRDFWVNVWVFARNFWAVFWHIPAMIWKFLNQWIQKIEEFINSVSNWVNNLAKKLWLSWDLLWTVKLWRFSEWWNVAQLESFKSLNKDIASARNADIMQEMNDYSKSRDELMEITKDSLKEKLLELWKTNEKAKELDYEFKDTVNANNDEATEKAKGNAKSVTKVKDDELKKQAEQDKRYHEWLIKKEEERQKKIEERAKKIETWTWIIKDYYSTVRDELDKSQKKLDDFDKWIEDSQKKLSDLKADLESEKSWAWVDLAKKKIELEDKLRKLQQDNPAISQNTWISNETLKSIWGWILAWWVTADQVLEYKKLQDELNTINQNANLITEENKKQAEESESARIIRETLEKQLKIQTEIDAETKRLEDLKVLKDQEAEVYKWIDDYRTTLEHNFTALLQTEVAKRITTLEAMRVKAIETANALAKAWITTNNNTNNNNVSVNLQGTWYSSIDAKNIWNALTQQIDLSNKWINK